MCFIRTHLKSLLSQIAAILQRFLASGIQNGQHCPNGNETRCEAAVGIQFGCLGGAHCRQLGVAVCCSVLQCVAVCGSMLRWEYHLDAWEVHILRTQLCVAVYCSVLQCVVVCCSKWQCVAVRCKVLQCLVMLHSK